MTAAVKKIIEPFNQTPQHSKSVWLEKLKEPKNDALKQCDSSRIIPATALTHAHLV